MTLIFPETAQIRGGRDGELCGDQDQPRDALEDRVHDRGVQPFGLESLRGLSTAAAPSDALRQECDVPSTEHSSIQAIGALGVCFRR